MKVAIHKRKGSFSDRWISYCEKFNIKYKIVNCYNSDIINLLKDCDGLMWHWSHLDYKAQNFARQLTYSLEKKGLIVFPNFRNSWHFDDKVGQKYLFESLKIPHVNSYIFYDRKDALKWIDNMTFPIVFKLRAGAGSSNVRLIKDVKTGIKIINKSFKSGFPSVLRSSGFFDRIINFKKNKSKESFIHIIKGIIRLLFPKKNIHLLPYQKGYVYFQDYIPNNKFDDRVIVIGDKAIAVRRINRENDFRASGSGIKKYDSNIFPLKTIKLSFDTFNKLKAQSIAFDFIYDDTGNPLIVEISYAFVSGSFYDDCPGYWTSDLIFHKSKINPQKFIIENFLNTLNENYLSNR